MKSSYLMKRLITPNHVFYRVPSFIHSFQYSLMEPPKQILGSNPVLWEVDNTGHSLKQSQTKTTTTTTLKHQMPIQ
jgi:hypothetical protein